MPIHFKYHVQKLKSYITGLTCYYVCMSCELLLMPLETDTYAHTPTSWKKVIPINQACAGQRGRHTPGLKTWSRLMVVSHVAHKVELRCN